MTADGFDTWMASQGSPATTMIDGYEVVAHETTDDLSGTEMLDLLDQAGDEPLCFTR